MYVITNFKAQFGVPASSQISAENFVIYTTTNSTSESLWSLRGFIGWWNTTNHQYVQVGLILFSFDSLINFSTTSSRRETTETRETTYSRRRRTIEEEIRIDPNCDQLLRVLRRQCDQSTLSYGCRDVCWCLTAMS